MDNELIVEQNWWKRNWKWFLPTSLFIILTLFWVILTSTLDGNITDIAQAYSDNSLYEKAIEKAKKNKRVQETIGEIEPIDPLAILEGNAIYSNHNHSVELSVRIRGNKGKGKMNISADKNGKEWNYKKINILFKDSKEEIQILKNTTDRK